MMSNHLSAKTERRQQWAVVLIALLAVAWLQLPILFDAFRVDADFRIFYWMAKFQNPALFPGPTLTAPRFFTVSLFGYPLLIYPLSPGHGLLFFVASFLVSPITFSKVLPFISMPVAALYLLRLGNRIKPDGGFVLAIGFVFLNLAASTAISVAGGLQRSLALPLLIALTDYLHAQRYGRAGAALFLCSLFYPPTFPLGAAIWGVYVLKFVWPIDLKRIARQPAVIYLLGAILLSVLVMAPLALPYITNFQTTEPSASPPAVDEPDYRFVWEHPEFRADGQYPLFYVFPVVGRGGLVNRGIDGLHLAVLFAVAAMIAGVRGRKAFELPRAVWAIWWGTWLAFSLSWLVIILTTSFLLYEPSRYTRAGLFLFLVMAILLNINEFLSEAMLLLKRHRRNLGWLIAATEAIIIALIWLIPTEQATLFGINIKWALIPAGLLVGGLAAIALKQRPRAAIAPQPADHSPLGRLVVGGILALFVAGWAMYAPFTHLDSFLNPSPDERALHTYLHTLPPDTRLASTLDISDNIPLFAQRQVVLTFEHLSRNYPAAREMVSAFYAAEPQQVAGWCQKTGVDYLVIDRHAYSADYLAAGDVFSVTLTKDLAPEISARQTFAVTQLPENRKTFIAGDYFVAPCAAFGDSHDGPS